MPSDCARDAHPSISNIGFSSRQPRRHGEYGSEEIAFTSIVRSARAPSVHQCELCIPMTLTTGSTHGPHRPDWLPTVDVAGPHQLPVLHGASFTRMPTCAGAFSRPISKDRRSSALLHGYVGDLELLRLLKNPARFLALASEHQAVITPDLSLLRGMPVFERQWATWRSRAVGAFFEDRGIPVIPNLRWAELSDLDFVCDGLRNASTICISTQGILRDRELMHILEAGLVQVIKTLGPECVIVYGSCSPRLHVILERVPTSQQIQTDIGRIHSLVGG